MGRAQSKIDNEESVSRCKDRRNFMKEVVAARNSFAASQSGYVIALKDSGGALSDYAQGEAENNDNDSLNHHHHHNYGGGVTLPPPPPMLDATTLPPHPPPLPTFSLITPPIQRSVSMPEFKVPKANRKMKSVAIAEDEEYEEESDDVVNNQRNLQQQRRQNRTLESPPPLPNMKAWDYFSDVDMQGLSLSDSEDVNEQKDDENDDR